MTTEVRGADDHGAADGGELLLMASRTWTGWRGSEAVTRYVWRPMPVLQGDLRHRALLCLLALPRLAIDGGARYERKQTLSLSCRAFLHGGAMRKRSKSVKKFLTV